MGVKNKWQRRKVERRKESRI